MLSIGLMSGTSMDGIDAALIQSDGLAQIIPLGNTSLTYPHEAKLLFKSAEYAVKQAQGDLNQAKENYLAALQAYLQQELNLVDPKAMLRQLALYLYNGKVQPIHLEAIIQLSTRLHVATVKQLLLEIGKQASEIDIIGYHGQTLFHAPSAKITLQIGDGQMLADLTGIPVINNFRARDIAAGGQGAPFAPIYHQALAVRDNKIPLAVLNCGGIANITVICDTEPKHLIGFDTGPGNGLIDRLVRLRTHGQETMDTSGKYGLKGRINQDVLQALYDHAILMNDQNYFQLPPPKSLDINDMRLIPELDTLSLEDACTTLEAFTADAIVSSLKLLQLKPAEIPKHWVLAGGGWHNPVIKSQLIQRLKAILGDSITVKTADEAGWNSQAMEAQIFAYFAVRSLKNLPLSVPGSTGAPYPISGGEAYLPDRPIRPMVKRLLTENPKILKAY